MLRSFLTWWLLGIASLVSAADVERNDGPPGIEDSAGTGIKEIRVALVIGNAGYSEYPLSNPINDARAIAKSLSALGFEVTTLEDANQSAMKRAIDEFGDQLAGLGKRGVGLFYYAGHGVQVQGRNYLIPVGARIKTERQVEYESVDLSRVLGIMEDSRNAVNLVILDACRDNPFARSTRNAVSGLASMDAAVGMLIAYATAPGRTASDGAGDHGLYTEQLIRHMGTKGLKVEEVFKRVRVDVDRLSEGRQIPWESSSLRGDFYFGGRLRSAALESAPVAPPKLDEEEVLWRAIDGSLRSDDYDEYLKHYPQGRFAPAARVRLRQLQSGTGNGVVQSGMVMVKSNPAGASILVDGRPHGVTPTGEIVIPAGQHSLELRADGYRTWTDTIDLKAGQRLVIEQKLQPVPRFAALDARHLPGDALVLLDGRQLGYGGRTFEGIDPGSYELATVPARGRSSKRAITLEADQTRTVEWPPDRYSLAVFPGRLTGQYMEQVDKRWGALTNREWILRGMNEALNSEDAVKVSYSYYDGSPAERDPREELKNNSWKGVFSVEINKAFLRSKAAQMQVDAVLMLAVSVNGGSGPIDALIYDVSQDAIIQVKEQWKTGNLSSQVRTAVAKAMLKFVDAHKNVP